MSFKGDARMLGPEGLNAVTKEISVIWNIKLKNDIGRVRLRGIRANKYRISTSLE